ncbi:MAG: peptidoglycan DD-metalloendopeptidase family protein [Asgard group archaeon]|nr:peptidoglycan DD-metalloendopeptidase family protein [Asgard group archaeon]
MKKRGKITLIVFCLIIILIGIIIPILPFILRWNPTYGAPALEFPFENPDDIVWLRGYNLIEEGGSYSDHHEGIDLEISINGSKVISPCSGTIGLITSTVHKEKGHTMISINIRINLVWTVMIVFEPYSNSTELIEYQKSLLKVRFGQRIEIGDEIGLLLIGGEFPHIHYQVNKYLKDVCPFNFSTNEAKLLFLEIADKTNSTICYS